uniref:Uncharacterized protein n=1 Tax=Ackermannviridae sp. TaxID=2831612 RepID=A0A8S5RU00_9CAUD|nr:MAG TPA: hypothetical protein [Ackermannviridae sp.]
MLTPKPELNLNPCPDAIPAAGAFLSPKVHTKSTHFFTSQHHAALKARISRTVF